MPEYKGPRYDERLDIGREVRVVRVYGGSMEFPAEYPTFWMLRDIEFFRKHRN
ncbi:MAG: hypothetical protein HYW27_03040 [Candidatus Aenigmarchaeota archaeon]|nr:hypothetical protein [Candidatus Aenigmarchaeota archaeon]